MGDPRRIGEVLPALILKHASTGNAPPVQSKPTRPLDSASQRDLFRVETRWFPILRAMVESGVMKGLGPMATAAYICLKANAELRSGKAAISAPLIAEQMGMSTKGARIALKRLELEGLVTTEERPGCRKVYQLVERIPLFDSTGEAAGEVMWDFSSNDWRGQLELIQRTIKQIAYDAANGAANRQTTVNIGALNINIVIASTRKEPQ